MTPSKSMPQKNNHHFKVGTSVSMCIIGILSKNTSRGSHLEEYEKDTKRRDKNDNNS